METNYQTQSDFVMAAECTETTDVNIQIKELYSLFCGRGYMPTVLMIRGTLYLTGTLLWDNTTPLLTERVLILRSVEEESSQRNCSDIEPKTCLPILSCSCQSSYKHLEYGSLLAFTPGKINSKIYPQSYSGLSSKIHNRHQLYTLHKNIKI